MKIVEDQEKQRTKIIGKEYGNERKVDVENKRVTEVDRKKSWNLKQIRKLKGKIDRLIAYHHLTEDKTKGLNDPSKRYGSNLKAKK